MGRTVSKVSKQCSWRYFDANLSSPAYEIPLFFVTIGRCLPIWTPHHHHLCFCVGRSQILFRQTDATQDRLSKLKAERKQLVIALVLFLLGLIYPSVIIRESVTVYSQVVVYLVRTCTIMRNKTDTRFGPAHKMRKREITQTSSTKQDPIVMIVEGRKENECHLPFDFCPGPNDVICSRGKSNWDHPGNQYFRKMINTATKKYSAATSKLEKSLIVSDIANSIHQRNGKFVKKETEGRTLWVEIDETFMREKIGQSLRNGLHDKYRSSTKAKIEKRARANETFYGNVDKVLQSNTSILRRIDEMTNEVQKNGRFLSDFSVITLFSRANLHILETIKKDPSMHDRLSQYYC